MLTKHNFLRMTAAYKAGLPANIDECMAYFTGYKKSSVEVSSPDEFLSLARKCITYCNIMHDKETLHLLFYSIAKRFYYENEKYDISEEETLFKTWDVIAGDGAGLYQGNVPLQVQDMSYVFETWLSIIDSPKYAPKKEKMHIVPLTSWTQEGREPNAGNKAPEKLWFDAYSRASKMTRRDDLDVVVHYNRGGGLYCFLDMVKGLSPGFLDDEREIRGVYVTPNITQRQSGGQDVAGKRDQFYAYEFARARRFGDIPSYQSGTIAPNAAFIVNQNLYEAFIKTEDLVRLRVKGGSTQTTDQALSAHPAESQAHAAKAKAATVPIETVRIEPLLGSYEGHITQIFTGGSIAKLGVFMPETSEKPAFQARLDMIIKVASSGNPTLAKHLKAEYEPHFCPRSVRKEEGEAKLEAHPSPPRKETLARTPASTKPEVPASSSSPSAAPSVPSVPSVPATPTVPAAPEVDSSGPTAAPEVPETLETPPGFARK